MALITLKIDDNKIVRVDTNKADKMIKNLLKSKKLKNNKSKNLMHISNNKAIKKLIFLILNIKKTFNLLK